MTVISEYSGSGGMGRVVNGTYGCLVHVSDGAISELYRLLTDKRFSSRVTPELIKDCKDSTLNEFKSVLSERKLQETNGVTYEVLSGVYEVSSFIDWGNPSDVAKLKGLCDGYIDSYAMSDKELRRKVESLGKGTD
jgi:hypothetical protein